MAHGFQSINAGGIVQIDENYRNLLMVASGTWTGGGTPFGTIWFPTQYACAPLIFIRPSYDGCYVGPGEITQSNFSFMCNGNFDWVVYGLDSPAAHSSTSFGLQVFDGGGSVVYDSRYEAPRIQAVATVWMTWPQYLGVNSPDYPYYPSFTSWGGRPWFCLNSFVFFADDNGTCVCATTNGTGGLIVRCGTVWTTDWIWAGNNGEGGMYAQSYPGGRMTIPLLAR
jgi:hypothetical protein